MSAPVTEPAPVADASPSSPAAGPTAETPIVVSATAAAKIAEIRAEEQLDDSQILRLKVKGGGCSGLSYDLYFDQQGEADLIFESNGVRVICDQMSLMYLAGTEVDYVDGVQGAGFKFNNPNVKSTCGCGSSFAA
jgi:iron-sulfur cluster assembly accessory protein